MVKKLIGGAVVMLTAFAMFASGAEAVVSYNLDYVFSGNNPNSSSSWGTISFENNGTDTVKVTMTGSLENSSEFFSKWGFSTSESVAGLSFGAITVNSGTVTGATISSCTQANPANCSNNPFKFDGDGYYQIVVGFQTSAGTGQFTGTESISFNITGTGLVEGDFSPGSVGGENGSYHTSAHIQGITGTSSCSAFVGDSTGTQGGGTSGACPGSSVPEPGSLALLGGSGLIGLSLAALRFRRR